MAIAAQQHREIVKPSDDALQFDAIHQEYRDGRFGFANVIQEDILHVLGLFSGHWTGPSFCWSPTRHGPAKTISGRRRAYFGMSGWFDK
jgi:hypothetical protein